MAAHERRTTSGSVVVADRKRHWLFDRPRPPRDWRWVVGGVGKTLIVIGLLMFAFVAYQLWGTGIYTAQAQNELDDQFTEAGVAATTAPAPTVVTTTTVAPASTSSGPPVPSGSPGTPTTATTPTTTATSTTVAPTTSTGPMTVPFPYADPSTGDVLVQLQIPSIDVDHKVVQGVGLDQLKRGPGHFPESVLPGQLGNSAIAGHRTTYGAPFYDVDKLKPGDTIVITYPPIGGQRGPQFTYVVTGTDIVSPSDYSLVVPTTDATRATLVLSSCHPIRTANQRIIVRAELDPSRSSTLFAPTPTGVADASRSLPGEDDPALSTTTAGPATSDATDAPVTPTTGGPSTSGPATSGPSTSGPATSGRATDTATTAPAASEDAFAGGWFDDSAAWPQIVLWGLLLAAVSIGGYVLARRQRRIWLGVLASFVPFVVILYFWFENINRLLPPGL